MREKGFPVSVGRWDDQESDRMLILSLKRDIDMLRQQVEALTRHLGVTAPRSGTHLPYR